MGKLYQVRYTVADKTVAHEHYTEKGARDDARKLSKVIGNAMIGEIDVADDGSQELVRIWEFTGGEIGKPIPRDGAPTPVEIIKTADETRLPESKAEKKPRTPRMSDEERIAAVKADAEDKLARIAAGTFVIPKPGKKATGEPRAPRSASDERPGKIMEELKVSQHTAAILAGAQLNASGRRARAVAYVIESGGSVLASEVAAALNETGKEDRVVDADDVMSAVRHLNAKFDKFEQPWKIKVTKSGEDFSLSLKTVKVIYSDDEEGDESPRSEVA